MPVRIFVDEGCDCLLDPDLFAIPFPLRRQPPLRLVYSRQDRRGRRTYVKAKAEDLLVWRKA